jgi:hypothetical protein
MDLTPSGVNSTASDPDSRQRLPSNAKRNGTISKRGKHRALEHPNEAAFHP